MSINICFNSDPEKPEYEISFTSRTDAMTWDQCASYAKQSDSEFYRGREIWRSSLEVLGCKFWAKPNNETVIERVCKSVNTRGGLPHSSTKPKNGTEVKIYHNYCTTELCNTGDGRKILLSNFIFFLWKTVYEFVLLQV